MKLTKHFSLEEFERSDYAIRHGINNSMPPEYIIRATLLAANVLEPVREHFDSPVIITSGYRSSELNKAIGGSKHSQHMKGEAADIHVVGVPNIEVAEYIRDNLEYDQLIHEGRWVHVSYRENANRGEVLTAHFGENGVTYTRGIETTA